MSSPSTSLLAPIYEKLLGNNCRITATNDYVGHFLELLKNKNEPWTLDEKRLICSEYSLLFLREQEAAAAKKGEILFCPHENLRSESEIDECTRQCRERAPALVAELEYLVEYAETLDCFPDQLSPLERMNDFRSRARMLPTETDDNTEIFLPSYLINLHYDLWLNINFEQDSEDEEVDEDDEDWVEELWTKLRMIREFAENGRPEL